jgi:hypothetical protein
LSTKQSGISLPEKERHVDEAGQGRDLDEGVDHREIVARAHGEEYPECEKAVEKRALPSSFHEEYPVLRNPSMLEWRIDFPVLPGIL